MLVTFSCDAYENIIMFGDVAIKLLHLMGNSGTIPGAILADDVPDALAHLQAGIAKNKTDDDSGVSLNHRAIPLIAMLTAAVKGKCNVMWA